MTSIPAPMAPTGPAPSPLTGAALLVEHFRARGVTHVYGVPGGDCSLDIIAAAEAAGIRFVLARTENGAAMMAAAGYQVTGNLGVVVTTRGPGLANGANGVACAMLDRCGIVIISDGYEAEQSFVSHQRFDQARLLQPVTKGSLRLDSPGALPALGDLLDLAMAAPAGPVYLEVTGKGMRTEVPRASQPVRMAPLLADAPPDSDALGQARALMGNARRPVIIAGLQTRDAGAADGLRTLAAAWRCPVFTTYMGKGSIADADPLAMGHFMAGAAEDETLQAADLIVTYGLDPVELLPKPWRYPAPVLELASRRFPRTHVVPAVAVTGRLQGIASGLAERLVPSPWTADALQALKAHMRDRATALVDGQLTPTLLAQTACRLLGPGARIAVDAGAHMLPVIAYFDAQATRDVLISRGLATMAYALPSAIGAALSEPSRRVVAFTGDGGLMMCAGELATAAQYGARVTVVVFNDSSIAMIGVKQRQRGLARQGMDYSDSDFAKVADGFGCTSLRVTDPSQLEAALQAALAVDGPSLVDVTVRPDTYDAQLKSLRG